MLQQPNKLFFLLTALIAIVACSGERPEPTPYSVATAQVSAYTTPGRPGSTSSSIPPASSQVPKNIQVRIASRPVETVDLQTLFARAPEFPSLMPCLQRTLRQALGELFNRNATDQEMELILACVREHARELLPQGSSNLAKPRATPPSQSTRSRPKEEVPQRTNGATEKTATPTSLVAGQLTNVLIPKATATPPDITGCQTFEAGTCSELQWELLSGLLSGEVTRIRLAPSNPKIIYAVFDANDMSAWKSSDAGVSWKRVDHFAHASDLVVHPTDPDIALYSTLENNVYGTQDGGATWESVLTATAGFERGATQFNALAQSTSQPNVLYTATGGASQRGRSSGGNSAIYRSSDTGNQWETVWAGSELGAVYSLAVSSKNPNEVFAGSNTGIFRSINAGETWDSVWSIQQMRGGEVYSLANTPAKPSLFIAAHTEIGIIRSADGGITWAQANDGITDTRIHEAVIAPSNPQVIYAGTHGGVFRSNDEGLSWESRTNGIGFPNVSTLDVHPSNPDIVYAGTGVQNTTNHHKHFVPGFQSDDGMYVTKDGGHSWTRTDTGVEEHGIVTLASDPNLPFRFWLGGRAGRGAFMSQDGGNTFLYNASPASHYAMMIASGKRSPFPIYMTSWQRGAELTKSNDVGETWTSLTTQLVNGISAESRAAGLYKDSGVPIIHLHALTIDPNDDETVYVGSVHDNVNPVNFSLTGVHIFKSSDGGKSFTESSQGIPIEAQTSVGFIAVDPNDSNLVYAGFTRHESVISLGIYKSTNAGKTWEQANEGLTDSSNVQSAQDRLFATLQGTGSRDVRHLVIDPVNRGTIFAATAGGVFKSINSGTKWSNTNAGITTQNIYTLAISPRNSNVLYAATADGIFKTKDGGASWYAVNLGLPIGSQSYTMGHHVVLAFDATGGVLFAVIQTGKSEFNSQRLVYRAVLEPLSKVDYTYSLGTGGNLRDVGFESTSSIHSLSFSQDDNSIDFVASGPSGTAGHTSVLLPTSLLVPPFEVTHDGAPLDFELGALKGAINTISFSYSHKVGRVTIEGLIPRLSADDISTINKACNQKPVIPKRGYQGLLTDVHVHTAPQFNQVDFAKTLLEEMNANGVDRVVLQPNHRPAGDVERVQSVDQTWGEIGGICSRLIPMVYSFNPDLTDSWQYVKDTLNAGKYGGVGEIEFQHGTFDLSHDPKSESMLKIYDLLETKGLAMHFQAMLNRNPSLAEKLESVISSRPNLNFVWFGNTLSEEFLALPNLYGETFLKRAVLRSDKKLAKSMIASDSSPSGFDNPSITYDNFSDAMVQIRQRLSELPLEIANALAHGNFNKVWPKTSNTST